MDNYSIGRQIPVRKSPISDLDGERYSFLANRGPRACFERLTYSPRLIFKVLVLEIIPRVRDIGIWRAANTSDQT